MNDQKAVFHQNNVTLTFHIFTNNPVFYSKRWLENIQSSTRKPIETFDGVILGYMNIYTEAYKDAAMWTNMQKYAATHPEERIDLAGCSEGVTFMDLANQYTTGPIIWASMFSKVTENKHKEVVTQMKILEKASRAMHKSNSTKPTQQIMKAIDGRKHIRDMGDHDCASLERGAVSTCSTWTTGHRCVGDKGGQPDLLAWDVVEALWEVFG